MQILMGILRQAVRLDGWLYSRLGPPYGVLLSVGLVIEIGRHGHELVEHAGAGLFRHLLPILLDLALLLHTLGALQERLERRGERLAADPVRSARPPHK